MKTATLRGQGYLACALLFLVALFVRHTRVSFAQETVRVEVFITANGEPLPGVGIEIYGTSTSLFEVTNAAGVATFEIRPGTYTARAQISGFSVPSERFTVTLTGSNVVRINVPMPRDEPPPPPPPPPPSPPTEPPPYQSETTSTVPPPTPGRSPAGPFWNSWITKDGRAPVDEVRLGGSGLYRVHFDLSQFTYGVWGENVDVAAASLELVNRTREFDTEPMPLDIRIQVLGEGLELVSGRQARVEIATHRLLPGEVEGICDPRDYPSILDLPDSMTLSQFSQECSAGGFRIRVRASSPGCAVLAISVTEAGRVRPIEHIVRRLTVADAAGRSPTCARSDDLEQSMEAGLETLLGSRGAPPVSAALHIFELEFDNREPASAGFYIESSGDFWAWELGAPIRDYLSDVENLQASLQAAHESLSTRGSLDYGGAAAELAGAIFSGANDSDVEIAREALAALKRRVARASTPLTVFSRIVDRHGVDHILPLGLLAAGGERAILSNPIYTVAPLPLENYTREAACIRDWTFAIPTRMDGPSMDTPRIDALTTARGWIHRESDSLTLLESYLLPEADAQLPGREGFVLLAHHSGGRIYYTSEQSSQERLLAHTITRDFGGDGLAVLAVCNGGAIAPSDSQLVRRLNSFGINTVVVSPFQLNADYGQALAVGFAAAVQSANRTGEARTVIDLFDAAVSHAARSIQDSFGQDIHEMRFELVVAGNHLLRTCSADETP